MGERSDGGRRNERRRAGPGHERRPRPSPLTPSLPAPLRAPALGPALAPAPAAATVAGR